ncbi:peptidylprolyl isomerase [Acinetobacter indicus]|uniref:Chaperone SurA n=1 Tax=Acinetobacter indicus TaxID=756892 RepID=A0AAW8YYH3_9GAMM|nr:peptidylprolyl isomerase [Acinetobacter indicus]MCO8087914.1 peptidylprolyl isomerase [Acinetobacter indicus]MCO8100015.1 peptidylprolyl isomerase [Acinetobacter indicus]MCO8101728.1 peptidylprolyl isomerase [Acinetobacter indicus]MCO8105554.1 peptidylprolyl isomerase [Acinetobacter indicus]MCO8111214.1 peptidylprolyl isomerase [Acinetobacter indicus]
MKTPQLKQFFKATALALCISSATPAFAQTVDQVVAVVDNSVILQSDLAQTAAEMQQQLQAQNKTVPPAQYLQQQALEQLIVRQAQLEQVKRYNIKPDEKALNEAVMRVAQQNGSKSLEDFQQKVDRIAPGTYASLRNRIAEDLAINRLRQQVVMSRIKISDQDVDNFLKTPQGQAALGSQAHVLHVRVSGENAQATAEQVKTALNNSNDLNAINKQFSTASTKVESADMGFRSLSEIPAELAARVSALDVGQTTELIAVNDGIHVLKLVDRKAGEQRALVPQYQTRHILIQPTEVVSPENAKHMIDSLYNRLKAGEDFAVLAGTFSTDTGSARDGGSLGWVSPGVMVPEFEQQMKSTPVGEISQPFQTQFGWHILQVTDTRQQDMTREYQERMARQILGERQFDTELDSWLREIRSNAFVDIKDPNLDRKNN